MCRVRLQADEGFTEPGQGVRGRLADGTIAAVGQLEWVLQQVRTPSPAGRR